ncbi:signal peptidase I [Thiohalomonas denitrificans]|uniref:signal peptidase I n=1 Tax=Thiohalomonas denitrificans TaxID=415747 RepID=UPI0026EF7204|nr:signal peptidase I [Thiohalomonas denitrificans]
MNIDFPTILVVATLVTGLLWALDALLLAPKRRERVATLESAGQVLDANTREKMEREPVLIEYARSFFPIILLVLVVRSFVVEPFRIPSGSMMPTLEVGDFILVNKFTYGLRLPVLHSEIIDFGEPERGDIIVFRYPENPRIDYIKRVVGVPGDEVVYRDKVLYINGEQAEQTPLGTYNGNGGGAVMTGASERMEVLPGAEHRILVWPGRQDRDFAFSVPENEYFVMGDNRDNSRDSRFWGTVPNRNVVGKAFFVWMNWDSGADGIVAWDRIGTQID